MENVESKNKYEKLKEKVEIWTRKFRFSLVNVTVPALLMPQMIISYYLYFTTDLGSEAFSLAYPIWWVSKFPFISTNLKFCTFYFHLFCFWYVLLRAPFNWRTPIGYLIIFSMECATSAYVCHFCACFIGTYIASCDIMFNFCDEIKSQIHIMNENSQTKENAEQFKKRVVDIIVFHAKVKQLSYISIEFAIETCPKNILNLIGAIQLLNVLLFSFCQTGFRYE